MNKNKINNKNIEWIGLFIIMNYESLFTKCEQ